MCIDLCCLQQTWWKGDLNTCQNKWSLTRAITINSTGMETDRTVGVLLTEKWVEKVFGVQHFSDRIFILKMVICKSVHSFISVYTLKVGRSDADKDCFYDQLWDAVEKIPASEILIQCGYLNNHVGELATGYGMVHSRCGWGTRNLDGNCVPRVVACNLVIGDTCFKKMASHLITYQLGSSFWSMSRMPGKEIQGQHNQQVKKKFMLHLDMETQGPSCLARVLWCIHSWVWECWLKHSGSYHSLSEILSDMINTT